MAAGLLVPHAPVTLQGLAQLAHPLLPAFVDAVAQDELLALPQLVLADDLERSCVVQACIQYTTSGRWT